ncbi:2-dehydropantoate 2-reductase [Betaproteobacteria bacterium]|nr:2-dehydropantoate 2-reductase [Betaproteobacteria bacterium]GHU40228.1 2-dehydropantoate 2-reductase [Betaproteobacteria bacterium]
MTAAATVPKVAIFGAGAIGLWLAAEFALRGIPATLIARPKRVAEINREGLRYEAIDMRGRVEKSLHIVPADAPLSVLTAAAARDTGATFDVLLLAVKSQQILPSLPEIAPLLTPDTLIVCLQNGIPWWYFQGTTNVPLKCLDPDNAIPTVLPPERVLGCVIYKAAESLAPNQVTVRCASGDRLMLGSPLPGHASKGETATIDVLRTAGVNPQKSDDIRRDVWEKLMGNAVLNPVSALTWAKTDAIVNFAPTRDLAIACMQEAYAVAKAHGVTLKTSPLERLERARTVGTFRTSMLQDRERGRPLEVEGILGGLLELARLAKTPTPHLQTLYAITALLSRHSEGTP